MQIGCVRSVGILLFVSVFSLVWIPVYAETAVSNNREGIVAFKNKDYEKALVLFNQALNMGSRSDALYYNIAVCHYRLGQYSEARKYFDHLKSKPKWSNLTHYNLGLIAEAMQDKDAAINYFSMVTQQGRDEKLRVLSSRKIKSLTSVPVLAARKASAKDWAALVELSRGHDSNAVSLADDLQTSSSSVEDEFTELLLYGQRYLKGKAGSGVKMTGFAFGRRLDEFSHLDNAILNIGATREVPWKSQQIEAGLSATHIRVDSSRVANQLQGKLATSMATRYGTVTLGYLPSYYFASPDYNQIEGSQHRIDAGWRKKQNGLLWKFRYRYEINNRNDLERNGGFSSYSPQKHGFTGKLNWLVTPRLSTGLTLEWITSRYADKNRVRGFDGNVEEKTRKHDRSKFIINTSYILAKSWKVSGELSYTDAKDVFPLYEYEKYAGKVKMEYSF